MPLFIAEALRENNLQEAYESRPPYQQNDYVGWITRAKQDPTKMKRLNQMLEELRDGKLYMKMAYSPKKQKSNSAQKE
ncbi:MAG: YdeI/OmpD-associated family protein [Desulfobulbaceae bacterium]|nr:YdeI/OmpD-associated family protein [Desulfobulbaceae bacterium]